MATSRGDDLAKKFAARLHQAPQRGKTAIAPPTQTPRRPTASPRTASPRTATRTPPPATRPAPPIARGASDGRLRGHLVPFELHAEAARRKATLQAREGRKITWDTVAREGVALLLQRGSEIQARLTEIERMAAGARSRPRLVQATITPEQDEALVGLRFDLGERLATDVSYERLWAAALLMWLRAQR